MFKDFENRFARVNTFVDYLAEFASEMNEFVCSLIPRDEDASINKYLYDPLLEFCQNGGKCSRPLTCLLGTLVLGGNPDKAMRSAAAIELFQDAALIHDDIADEAQTRRNKPCLHVTEGTGNALNAGDFGLVLIDEIILEDDGLNPNELIVVLNQLYEMKRLTIEGQAIDLAWARDEVYDLTTQDYFNMATLKTAYYTCAYPLSIGSLLAGTYIEIVESLFKFGLKCGLAFQIKDDLLNVTSESTKDFALDITEGKRTLMAIHSLNNLGVGDKALLTEILKAKTTNSAEIREAISLMQRAGSIEFAQQQIDSLIAESKEYLFQYTKPSHARDILEDMANWCSQRTN